MTILRAQAHAVRVRGFEVQVVYRNGGRDKTVEEGRCRMCLRPWEVRRPTRHHLVPKYWFTERGLPIRLRDCDANVIPLCRLCHDWVEGDVGARRMLRKLLGGAEVGLAVRLRGQHWFDRKYPPVRSA